MVGRQDKTVTIRTKRKTSTKKLYSTTRKARDLTSAPVAIEQKATTSDPISSINLHIFIFFFEKSLSFFLQKAPFPHLYNLCKLYRDLEKRTKNCLTLLRKQSSAHSFRTSPALKKLNMSTLNLRSDEKSVICKICDYNHQKCIG